MKELGIVSESEKKCLEDIFSRKTALSQLLAVIPKDNNETYEKIIADYIETNKKMNQWWIDTSCFYHWVYDKTDGWKLDFKTNVVYLLSPDEIIELQKT